MRLQPDALHAWRRNLPQPTSAPRWPNHTPRRSSPRIQLDPRLDELTVHELDEVALPSLVGRSQRQIVAPAHLLDCLLVGPVDDDAIELVPGLKAADALGHACHVQTRVLLRLEHVERL